MIEETGQVIAVTGDSALVRAASRAGCERCASGRGCGGGVIGLLLADRLATVVARRRGIEVAVGDRVALAVPGRVLVGAAAAVYLMPLALMLLVLIAAAALWPGAGTAALTLCAAVGLCAGLLLSRRVARRRAASAWRPAIVRRLAPERACG